MSEYLIDQALAAIEAAQPTKLEDPIPVTPEQATAWSVYLSVDAALRGIAGSDEPDKYIRAAAAVGIPQAEIDAAVERAEALRN